MSKIHVTTADGNEQVYALGGEVVLGRDAAAGLSIPDVKLSRQHCRFYPSKSIWMLEDLGSSNGTRVNGLPTKKKRLADGDRIEVGTTVIVYESDAPEAAPLGGPAKKAVSSRLKSSATRGSASGRARRRKRR